MKKRLLSSRNSNLVFPLICDRYQKNRLLHMSDIDHTVRCFTKFVELGTFSIAALRLIRGLRKKIKKKLPPNWEKLFFLCACRVAFNVQKPVAWTWNISFTRSNNFLQCFRYKNVCLRRIFWSQIRGKTNFEFPLSTLEA